MLAQSTVALAGTPANTGAVPSVTVMVCEAMLTFPASSVAVQVLVIVWQPVVPLLVSLNEMVGVASQKSVAVTLLAAGGIVAPQSKFKFGGTLANVGGTTSVSVTVMVWLFVPTLPQPSVADQVLVNI